MAEYVAESTVPDEAMELADYYVRGIERVEAEGTAAIPRSDMAPAVATALGLDMGRTARVSEVANLLQGLRADGEAIEGRQSYKVGAGQDRVSYPACRSTGRVNGWKRSTVRSRAGRGASCIWRWMPPAA